MSKSSTFDIEIRAVGGKIRYFDRENREVTGDVTAPRKASIVWLCRRNDFTLHVKSGARLVFGRSATVLRSQPDTPFDNCIYAVKRNQPLKLVVREDVTQQTIFSYGVTVFTSAGIYTDDPRIIIG